MKKLSLYKTKIIIYDNRKVIIENYNQIKKYNSDEVIIDNIIIKGKKMTILQMDEINMTIIGQNYEIKCL